LRSLLQKGEVVQIYGISVDAPDKSKELKQKIAADGKGAVTFPILSDVGHQVIDAYSIREHQYDGKSYGNISLEGIPQPAVYLIDKDGRVAWMSVDADYKKRPTNAEIRTALDALTRKK